MSMSFMRRRRRSGKARKLAALGGLAFYKDLTNRSTAADYAAGSPTGTYTCARSASAPATYVDGNGVIRLVTTSDVPRYSGGYYDATGFHQANLGYLAERASTNLLIRTDGTAYADGLWTGWETGLSTKTGTIVTTNTAIPELTSIVGATSQRLQYTGIATDTNKTIIINPTTSTGVGTAANGDVFTDSVYIRSINGLTGVTSVKLNVRAYNAAGAYLGIRVGPDILASITSGWCKFSFAGTLIDATASQVRFDLTVAGVDENDTVDIEIALPQIEKLPYATSFIPTTTAALTRAADVLKYENAGNSTAAEETIFIKFMANSAFADDGTSRTLYSTETANRIATASGTKLNFSPNKTDSIAVSKDATNAIAANTSYVYAFVSKHSSPYIEIYLNGATNATYTAGDWTDPAFGTSFYVGSWTTVPRCIDGHIASIVKFGRALSASEIAQVTSILQ